ncbi:MAG: MFS transporter [Candidatus Methanomethylicaceae archaeon]
MLRIVLGYSIGAFAISVGLGIIATAVPLVSVKEYSANELELGIIGSLLALPYILGCPIFGRISDRIGRYPILFLGIIANSITSILYIFSEELMKIMILRIIEGLTLAMIWPIMDAIFGELSKSYNKAIFIYNFSWSLGLMAGSMFIGLLLIFDISIVFIVAVIFNIIGILMFYNNDYSITHESKCSNEYVDRKNIILMFYSMFILGFSLFSFYSLFPLHALNSQIDDYLIGYIIGMIGVARTIVFITYGKISNLISSHVLPIGMALLGISMIICWKFSNIIGFILATIMLGASVGLIYSNSISFITYVSSRGLYAGLLELALGLGEFIGPLTMGTLGFLYTPTLPYFIMSISAILSSILFLIKKFFYIFKTKTSI